MVHSTIFWGFMRNHINITSGLRRPMPVRLIPLMVLMVVLWASPLLAGDSSPPRCLMQPNYLEIRLPSRGLTRLPGEDLSGKCDDVTKEKWVRKSAGSLDLFVYADGPSGSGRYWDVTIGVAQGQRSKPKRGVCLTTSTVGWRTLQHYKRTPLPWLDDLDNDGRSELIIWSSFPLREDASMAEYGLVAWVYRLASQDTLIIDWDLSRRMAREIAEAYRSASGSAAAYPGRLGKAAADALEQFADERCLMPNDAP